MKKSNVIILAILAVAAGFFLWLWYYLGFNFVDDPFDLVLAIIWWAVVAALVAGIHAAEKRRQERVRTAYLAPGHIFNGEAGLVALDPGASPADVLQQTLAGLKYNFALSDLPDKDEVPFTYIVRTKKFKIEKESAEGEAADAASAPASDATANRAPASRDEEVTWEGEVLVVSRPDDDPLPFASREELLHIVEGAPLPTTDAGMPLNKTAPLGA